MIVKSTCLFSLLFASPLLAQDPAADLREEGLVAIEQGLLDVQTIGRVMNIAAHPDDEDGATLAYCRHALGLETFAVFANRGEGGQNEIGTELYRELGAIREGETRRACALLGAEPYFLGLEDFGYSKTPQEAFSKWGRERTVERLVFAIRVCRPDIIFTNHDTERGHGQHRALAIAAREAFDLAGDPAAFPEHFAPRGALSGQGPVAGLYPWERGLRPWAPSLYLERAPRPRNGESEPEEHPLPTIELEVGGLDPLRGVTHPRQALRALQQHASQGRWGRLGSGRRRFRVIKRRHLRWLPEATGPFDPTALTRSRVTRCLAGETWPDVSATDLAASLCEGLLRRRTWPSAREPRALAASLADFGLDLEPFIERLEKGRAGEDPVSRRVELRWDLLALRSRIDALLARTLEVRVVVDTESKHPIASAFKLSTKIEGVDRPETQVEQLGETPTPPVLTVNLPADAFTVPLWACPTYDSFHPGRTRVGVKHTFRHLPTNRTFSLEQRPEIGLRPWITVDFNPRRRVLIAPADEAEVLISVLAVVDLASDIDAPIEVVLAAADTSGAPLWTGTLPTQAGSHMLPIRFTARRRSGRLPTLALTSSDARVVTLSPLNVTVLDARVTPGLKVGVVRSYDDTLESALRDLGVAVRQLTSDDLAFRDLSGLDVILVDIRAYLVRADLVQFNDRLLQYVADGGTLAVFYQKTGEWNPRGGAEGDESAQRFLGPFPMRLSRNRVVDENAPITLLQPEHPLLSRPNRLGAADFLGWVHERGLYFPAEDHDPRYQQLLACSDQGEDPLQSGLLVAHHGRGIYVYTCLSWYRQWRNGHPGAYRFLANLISLSGEDEG